jgi:hypothetical protein
MTGFLLPKKRSSKTAEYLSADQFLKAFNEEIDILSQSLECEDSIMLENAVAVLISFQNGLHGDKGEVFARYLYSAIVARNAKSNLSNRLPDNSPETVEEILQDAVCSLTIIARSQKNAITLGTVLGALHTLFRLLTQEDDRAA